MNKTTQNEYNYAKARKDYHSSSLLAHLLECGRALGPLLLGLLEEAGLLVALGAGLERALSAS